MTVLFYLVYFLVPYLLKDLVGAEHPAGIRCQKVQDIELDGRQLDLLSVDNDLVVIFIDRSPRIEISFFAAFPVLLLGFNWV